MRRDLVFHHGCAAHRSHEPPCAAGGAHGAHAHGVAVNLRPEVGHHAPCGVGRVALGPQICARDDAPLGIDDHAFRGDGSDVDAQVAVRLLWRDGRSCRRCDAFLPWRNGLTARRCDAFLRRLLPLQALLACCTVRLSRRVGRAARSRGTRRCRTFTRQALFAVRPIGRTDGVRAVRRLVCQRAFMAIFGVGASRADTVDKGILHLFACSFFMASMS